MGRKRGIMEFDLKPMASRGIRILGISLLAILVWRGSGGFISIYTKYPYPGPTWASQRPLQRQKVQQRIAAIGGWEALRQVSEKFCRDHPGRFDWNSGMGSKTALPTAFASLSPMRVSINAHPEIVYPVNGRVVELHFFGSHSTGSYGVPGYDIWVVCGNAPGYIPDVSHFHGSITTGVANRIQKGIFEVY
jgi:hypothetical protein